MTTLKILKKKDLSVAQKKSGVTLKKRKIPSLVWVNDD